MDNNNSHNVTEESNKQLDADADANNFWNSLSYDEKLMAFHYVTSKIYQAEVTDPGTFRHSMYEIFKFSPDSYEIGMNSGYFAIHNLIYDGLKYEKIKYATKISITQDSENDKIDLNLTGPFKFVYDSDSETLNIIIQDDYEY